MVDQIFARINAGALMKMKEKRGLLSNEFVAEKQFTGLGVRAMEKMEVYDER